MEEKSIQQLIAEYLDLLRRGKYFIIVPLVIAVFLGTAIAFKLPKIYRSEARMFYMQAQLPDWAQLETINMYLEAMLIFIEAMALTPDNVLRLIKELDLYPDLEGQVASSDIIKQFKSNYSLEYNYTEVPSRYGRTEEVITGFTFGFDHTDARKSYYVANALATSFVEFFRKFREATSSRSSTFFEAERERLRREMSVIDQQIANFKQKHVNELPELFALNYRMVESLNNKLFTLDQKMLQLRGQRRNIEAQLSTISPVLGMTGLSGERIVTPEERLAALRAEIGQLRARYSERHPDVQRAQHEIAQLEALVAERAPVRSDEGGGKEDRSSLAARYATEQSGGAFNPLYTQLMVQLEEIKIDMDSLQKERAGYEKDLTEYERRVGLTPFVEKEWLILARDRESAQSRFNELASQVLTMESAAEMEKRELGGRLSIGQPPAIPLEPYKPNVPMIIGVSVFAGLFIGFGLLLGWDYLTRTVRTPADLLPFHQTSVLIELPMIDKESRTLGFIFNRTFLRIALVLLLVVIVATVDMFYMKVDVLFVKVFSLIQTKLALLGF